MKNIKRFVAFLTLVCTLTGCGTTITTTEAKITEATSATITPSVEPTETPESTVEPIETPEPTVEPIETPEPTVEPTEETDYVSFNKDYTREYYNFSGENRNSLDGKDDVNKYSFRKENVEHPYFIGREDSSATNFSKNNEHDKILYLGKPLYLATTMDKDVYYVSIDDETVAKIDGDEIIPLRQGLFTLTTYDIEGNKIEDIVYCVTTYNDSKKPETIMKSITFPIVDENNILVAGYNKDLEYWETQCSTIMDVSYYFQARSFYYSSEGEPEINCLGLENGDMKNVMDDWMWNNSVETVFENNKGVCLQAAQMAVHLLANDFEDWGVVMIDGKQGHIFNWFYEDGRYYVFDFTDVISMVAWGRTSLNYCDFSPMVQMFESYDDMTEWIKTSGKVDLEQNYLIYEYSLQGYDTLPANISTCKYGCDNILNGKEEAIVCFQDIIMEDLNIIYIKDGCKVSFNSVALEDMPSRLPHGVFGRDEEYRYYYDYHK